MSTDDRSSYLETGAGDGIEGADRIDRIRTVLGREETWAEPPAGLLEDILRETGRNVTPLPTRSPRRSHPGMRVAAILALVLVGLILILGNGQVEEEGTMVAMEGTVLAPAARGQAMVRETPSGWYIRLEVRGLPPAPEGSYYEGWLWREGEGVSIGTFHMRSTEPVALWAGVSPSDYPVVHITLQDEGEGPAPSDRLMMSGTMPDG